MEIYLAKSKDVYDISVILNESWNYAYTGIIPDNVIEERNLSRYSNLKQAVKDDNDSYYIVRDDSTPVAAFCIGRSVDRDASKHTYEVGVMYVRPMYMRRGIGSWVMSYIIDKAKQLKMKTIKIWVLSQNQNAINFYMKNGFIADGETKIMRYGKDMELLRMEMLLD